MSNQAAVKLFTSRIKAADPAAPAAAFEENVFLRHARSAVTRQTPAAKHTPALSSGRGRKKKSTAAAGITQRQWQKGGDTLFRKKSITPSQTKIESAAQI